MSTPAPNGAILDYQGTWQSTFFTAPTQVLSAVISSLSRAGLAVRNQFGGAQVNSCAIIATTIGLSGTPFGVHLQLQVQNGVGFGDITDVESIIDSAVMDASGTLPSSDSITSVCGVSTCQPAGGCCQGPGFLDGVVKKVESLTTQSLWVIGLVAIAVIGGVILLDTPVTRGVAKRVAG